MSVSISLAGVDRTQDIDQDGLSVQQILGSQRDTATLFYKKYGAKSYVPQVFDTVLITDGAMKVLAGRVTAVTQLPISAADGISFQIDCADYSIDLDSLLVSATYSGQTVQAIIADIVANYAPGFTTANVSCSFMVPSIVFNQVPISQALRKLANLMKYDWYVDPDKDLHFYPKYTELAPFGLTDSSGNYVNKSLQTAAEGTQIANVVKVRGGIYNGALFSDKITVSGNVSLSFPLPYQFANLSVTLDTGGGPVAKTIGIKNIDSFPGVDVLYDYQAQTIEFPSVLAAGNIIAFSGNPKIPVLAIASDAPSIAAYGTREKIIEDSSIIDLDVARQRAVAELAAYKDPQQQARFTTYTPGLRTGQVININSARRGINTDFIIRAVTFRMRTPTDFFYEVELVTIRTYTLIEVLQSLLQPADAQLDPNEVSEVIKTDLQAITIVESITRRSADGTDVATVTISENIVKDPLGAGVAPTWVLGPYIPSSVSDTNRVINLDRGSAVLY